MVGVEGIAEWIGREVVDRDGEKVGKLDDVYYDTTDHTPTFVAVKSGAFGRSHSVAPLTGATLSRDYVRLDAAKEIVKDAPQDSSGGRLTGVDAVAVLRHYGLPADADLEDEPRVCFQTAGAEEETERKRAEVAAEQARSAAEGAAATAAAGRASPSEPDLDDTASVVDRDDRAPVAARDDTAPAAGRDHPAPVVDRQLSAAEPEPAPAFPADDDPLARLAQLERRVAALEARL